MVYNNVKLLKNNIKYYSITASTLLNNNYSMQNKINIKDDISFDSSCSENDSKKDNLNKSIINENINNFNIQNYCKRSNSQVIAKNKYNVDSLNESINFLKIKGKIKQYSDNLIYIINDNFDDFYESKYKYMLIDNISIKGPEGVFYYKVIDKSKNEYFFKVYANFKDVKYIINEIKNQNTLSRYGNIAKFCEAYFENIVRFSRPYVKYYTFYEYYPNGDLFDILMKHNTENTLCKLMKQVIDSLYICHSNGISHRDIKLENFVLDKDFNIRLIDFEYSTTLEEDDIPCGTDPYFSPELKNCRQYILKKINNEKNNSDEDCRDKNYIDENDYEFIKKRKYNCKKNDIYGLGVVLYTLKYKRFPKTNKDTGFHIVDKNLVIANNIKTHLNVLLKHIFVKEEYRYTIDEVRDSDLYKFIDNYCKEDNI